MSNYHRSTHRASENFSRIKDWGSTKGNNLTEVGRGDNSLDKAMMKTRVAQETVKAKQAEPKKVVHTNVSKADPEIQGVIKNKARKTGKDTYTYEKGKEPPLKKWGTDAEIKKAHTVPAKGTVGVLGRNGQDYDVYSPGNPGYLGSPGHKTPTKASAKAKKDIPALQKSKTAEVLKKANERSRRKR